MFFTREDILKIQQALLQLGVKDSELSSAEPVTYDDTLSIVQDGKNKQIGVKDFCNQISLWKREDFINITDKYDEHYISLTKAINLVPILQRKDGLVITFQDVESNWEIYQFRGNITEFLEENKWFDLYDYRNYIVQSIVPDEEDLTASTPNKNGNSLVSLKDRVYDPTNFSGKGYKILRKNIVNEKNILTQEMINEPNTIYEIRYDFELNEQEITIPEGCTLKFNGGNLTNGLIISNKTKIQNAPYIDKTANLKITGKVYDINNNEITHYKWEIINRKCKLYTTLIPWWDFLNDVENAYRIGVTDFHIVLHISSNNNTNFEVTDTYYYSDERFVNKILKYNLSTPCLKLHIDEGKPFGSAPYNTVSYIENTINYVKTLVSKYRELGLKFDKFWVSNEHVNVTCNDDNNSADLWRSYLIDLKTWLQTNYNISCWASLQQPVLAMASYNDINISANFYPRISSFDDRYCSNVDTLNNLVSQINTYIASCPNNISYVISECGCTGIYKSLRSPENYSLKGQMYLYIFDKFYSAIVEALNQCQIDEWVIWYGDAPSGLKGAQDLVYNILRKLL